jgi:hypothetical protein
MRAIAIEWRWYGVWLKLMLTQVVEERERDQKWPLYYSIVIANKMALT